MAERAFNNIDKVSATIKTELDTPHADTEKTKKVSIIYASNASRGTRLSKIFNQDNEKEVLRYNAYIEDLFACDNENDAIRIDSNHWIFRLIKDQTLQPDVVDEFKRLAGSSEEPLVDIDNRKISRGEESILKWSVFFNFLETAVEALNEVEVNRTTDFFNKIKKYHLNLFRSLLEKTAFFLGYYEWQLLLKDCPAGRDFKKLIEHFSHNSLSDLGYKSLDKEKIEEFKAAFNFFIEKFKWKQVYE